MTKRSKAIQWLTNSRRRFTVNNEKSYRLVLFKTLQKEKMFTLLTVALVACNFFVKGCVLAVSSGPWCF